MVALKALSWNGLLVAALVAGGPFNLVMFPGLRSREAVCQGTLAACLFFFWNTSVHMVCTDPKFVVPKCVRYMPAIVA